MTEQITSLEKCWYISPPWGNSIPPLEVNLSERVYLKTSKAFGYCYGVQWHQGRWHYFVEIGDEIIHATKHQIIGTGRMQIEAGVKGAGGMGENLSPPHPAPCPLSLPAFILGDRVLLRSCVRGSNQRLILGIQLVETSWFYFVELVSPTLPLNTPHRFCLVREEDLVRVNQR